VYLPDLSDLRAEAVAREMFEDLRTLMVERVHDAGWLDASSRQLSESKVQRVGLRLIGDVAPTETPAALIPGSFLDATRQIRSSILRDAFEKVGTTPPRPVFHRSFISSAYSVEMNAIWLSPEIVRTPFIRRSASDPISLGALGTLIGHELGHTLSPRGRWFNAAGLYGETWSKDARAAFDARVACVERHFDRLFTASQQKVSARYTSDENVADLVGVQLALTALDAGIDPRSPENLRTARREFFVSYAQSFCGFGAPHLSELEAAQDRHTPLRARINGTLANIAAFAETFACRAGGPLAPRDRCVVW
jgi:predicted metalloendopeptidase